MRGRKKSEKKKEDQTSRKHKAAREKFTPQQEVGVELNMWVELWPQALRCLLSGGSTVSCYCHVSASHKPVTNEIFATVAGMLHKNKQIKQKSKHENKGKCLCCTKYKWFRKYILHWFCIVISNPFYFR